MAGNNSSGRHVTEESKVQFVQLRLSGVRVTEAGRAVGWSKNTVTRYEKILMGKYLENQKEAPPPRKIVIIDDQTPAEVIAGDILNIAEYSKEAKKALIDFGYFRRRYFGRHTSPWQEEAAYQMLAFLETPRKEFVVVNAPPGVGKSTLFTHDVCAWLCCRNRAIRILIGSRTERQAIQYTMRLRRSFERQTPLKADEDLVKQGIAFHAQATLRDDFGRFKPLTADLWRSNEFVLAQQNEALLEDKEPSVSAYGMDSGFLGGRYNLCVWDDLVDKKSNSTAEAREKLINWYETEAETRVEPGGLFLLQGQRMGPDDLYRYALDLKRGAKDGDESLQKYHHIIYKAHYEERCANPGDEEAHENTAAYPEGCLLDPVRLTYEDLRTVEANRLDRFLCIYQQEDIDPSATLVNPLWVEGGRGTDGVDYPGCWDYSRFPASLTASKLQGDLVSIVAVDPSPTKYWALVWLVYQPETQLYHMMDLLRQPMDAPSFLDWSYQTNSFTGVMPEWQQRSKDLGLPITHWIVEANVAQRFLLQFEHVKRFEAQQSISIIPHQTHKNKTDPDFGVQSLGPHFKFGRIRMPAAGNGKQVFNQLIKEAIRWPSPGSTDDTVMALWMAIWNLPNLYIPKGPPPQFKRPSWLKSGGNPLTIR